VAQLQVLALELAARLQVLHSGTGWYNFRWNLAAQLQAPPGGTTQALVLELVRLQVLYWNRGNDFRWNWRHNFALPPVAQLQAGTGTELVARLQVLSVLETGIVTLL